MIRLYELDDNPDRRLFLDKLLHYMEERGTPLTQCPTISKQPLDLYRLYHYTKERGGYLEVRVLYKTIYIIYTVLKYINNLVTMTWLIPKIRCYYSLGPRFSVQVYMSSKYKIELDAINVC